MLTSDYCTRLKFELKESVKREYSNTLLLSGGLDSTILASIARPTHMLTVVWDKSSPDLRFAKEVARRQNAIHTEVTLNNEEYLSKLFRIVIQSLKTFSPMDVRNSVVSCAGLVKAKHLGYDSVMTGDGCDELFVGYKYLTKYFHDFERLEIEMNRLWSIMEFSSKNLSNALGLQLRTPFLDYQFLDYAKSIPLYEKVGKYSGKFWGKYILRTCFLEEIGYDFAWRSKLAQQEGAGTVKLMSHFNDKYDDGDFQAKAELALKEGVDISNKEQLRYYEIFRAYFCPPADEKCIDSRCPRCSGCIPSHSSYCRVCGSFPIIPIKV